MSKERKKWIQTIINGSGGGKEGKGKDEPKGRGRKEKGGVRGGKMEDSEKKKRK